MASCEALASSMPKRIKAVLENNGGHTKKFTLWDSSDSELSAGKPHVGLNLPTQRRNSSALRSFRECTL